MTIAQKSDIKTLAAFTVNYKILIFTISTITIITISTSSSSLKKIMNTLILF